MSAQALARPRSVRSSAATQPGVLPSHIERVEGVVEDLARAMEVAADEGARGHTKQVRASSELFLSRATRPLVYMISEYLALAGPN